MPGGHVLGWSTLEVTINLLASDLGAELDGPVRELAPHSGVVAIVEPEFGAVVSSDRVERPPEVVPIEPGSFRTARSQSCSCVYEARS